MNTHDIINEEKINGLMIRGKKFNAVDLREIIERSKDCQGLSLEEAAVLLQIEDPDLLEELYGAARHVKNEIYGKRIVVFAPLYTSNECTNNCLYCGFRAANKSLQRKTLTPGEAVAEAKAIEGQGHKRILMVCGEDPKKTNINHITGILNRIYQETDIRRINVNAAPLSVTDFKKLKEAGIGTYQIFQETYHRETYRQMHPTGSKSNYDYRLLAIDRAFEAGIDDIGIGALLGLYHYQFDVLATLFHANYMDQTYHIGPHTISVPRLRPALDSALKKAPYAVSDQDLKKIVAVYRLALPYTGIILSTRETPQLRDELLSLGVSQVSAGSKTSPGGYEQEYQRASQFETADERSLNQVLQVICGQGHLPSFCTACYRTKRTGEAFMELAKDAHIHEFCQSNAILTLQEYLLDYADDDTLQQGKALIERELEEIDDEKIRCLTEEKLEAIRSGKRDLYF
ncbi:[FeFe] hydrogenase H-cluster radical SAM maturase HydG [Alkaliphilus crotonatoxidans]